MSTRGKIKAFFRKIRNNLKVSNDTKNNINIDAEIMGNVKIKIGGGKITKLI